MAHPPSSPALAGLEEPPPDKPPYLVDPGLVERLAKAAFKGIEAWEQTQLYVRSRTIFGDEAAAREFALKSGPPPGCVEVMGAALAEISQKYDLVGQWTPEVALTVGILTWAGKDVLLFADLEKRAAKMPAGAVAQAAKP